MRYLSLVALVAFVLAAFVAMGCDNKPATPTEKPKPIPTASPGKAPDATPVDTAKAPAPTAGATK